MTIKDSFVSLYVRRYVIPGALVFNKPGFVDFKISGKTNIYARQIFYPADFFIDFESRIINEMGDKGKKVLYSIGKRFGYRFAQAGKFENIKDHPGEKIKDWIFIMSKFIEGTYASLIDNVTDVQLRKTDYTLKRFTVLENLGYEYIFATGGTAGVMAWLLQDPTIEAVLKETKKVDGFYEAVVESAPVAYLNSNYASSQIFTETKLDDLVEDFQDYVRFNAQTQTSCNNSFQTYLDFNMFNYEKGIITFGKNRLFLFEVSGTYLIEYDLKRLGYNKCLDILFESAFKTGYDLFSKFGKNNKEIFDVLSALGWGEVLPFSSSDKEVKVVVNHFPWCKWYKEVDFLIIRGFLSGVISKTSGKKVLFSKPVVDLSKGYLSLLFGGKYV